MRRRWVLLLLWGGSVVARDDAILVALTDAGGAAWTLHTDLLLVNPVFRWHIPWIERFSTLIASLLIRCYVIHWSWQVGHGFPLRWCPPWGCIWELLLQIVLVWDLVVELLVGLPEWRRVRMMQVLKALLLANRWQLLLAKRSFQRWHMTTQPLLILQVAMVEGIPTIASIMTMVWTVWIAPCSTTAAPTFTRVHVVKVSQVSWSQQAAAMLVWQIHCGASHEVLITTTTNSNSITDLITGNYRRELETALLILP